MRAGRASWTAEITAIIRATESIKPAGEGLFFDPYAACFLHASIRLLLKIRWLTLAMVWFAIDRRFPGASVTTASRIRFIDDCLKQNLHKRIDQVVILGAGYDSRAYRFSGLKSKRVFEVDHPTTQKLKKEKVSRIFGGLPDHVAYVPADFENDNLINRLAGAGYKNDVRTLFIWEAVSKYLAPNAVKDLLSAVSANSCRRSAIVFDYLFQSMVDGRSGGALAQKILAFQAKKGEPFIFGLPEKNPEQFVIASGFSSVKHFSAARIKRMYVSGMNRAKEFHPFWGIIHATI